MAMARLIEGNKKGLLGWKRTLLGSSIFQGVDTFHGKGWKKTTVGRRGGKWLLGTRARWGDGGVVLEEKKATCFELKNRSKGRPILWLRPRGGGRGAGSECRGKRF